jgi:hypothetical protein
LVVADVSGPDNRAGGGIVVAFQLRDPKRPYEIIHKGATKEEALDAAKELAKARGVSVWFEPAGTKEGLALVATFRA